MRVGKVVNKYKVGKHFKLDIQDDGFDFELDPGKVAAEAALDGIYVVRTSLAKQVMSAADAVRSYKLLSQVERAFRSFKTLDLEVRPIYHHLERRVRAHIFLCLLAYYVQWHMLEAWRPLLFSDEDLEAKTRVTRLRRPAARRPPSTKHSPGRSRTAARSTASAPCSSSSAVSSRTSAASRPQVPMRQPSRSSPRPTPSSRAPSISSKPSSCRQSPAVPAQVSR